VETLQEIENKRGEVHTNTHTHIHAEEKLLPAEEKVCYWRKEREEKKVGFEIRN
jgi:hypothetical protein